MRASCSSCGGPLASDQRYCLNCGHAVANPLPEIRTALASAPAGEPARPRARGRRLGMFGGMLLAGLAVGILAGGLINPSTGVQAAPLIAVRVPSGATSSATTAGATSGSPPVQAGAPAAPPPVSATPSTPPPMTTAAPTPAPDSNPAPASTTPSSGGSNTHTHKHKHHHSKPQPKPSIPVRLPKIGHVWIVMLADQSEETLFGPTSPAHYLNDTLVPQGTLLPDYYATAHGELADGIALLSGQGPTADIQADCPVYGNVTPGTVDTASGQARGNGCVFPTAVTTLPDQLAANELIWRAYVAGQGTPGDTSSTCRHPIDGTADSTAPTSQTSDGYVTRRNPFVYFQSLIAQPACSQSDVGLGQLGPDLASGSVPALSWIAPDLCAAGEAAGCPAGDATTGPAAADSFLSEWIPQIEATPAYQRDGMIVILSDQAPASGVGADSSACCGRPHYPNTTNPGGAGTPGPGGGKVGALILSRFAAQGKTDPTPSDHYTLLRTVEDIFTLPYLGYAADRRPFGRTTFPSERGGGAGPGSRGHGSPIAGGGHGSVST